MPPARRKKRRSPSRAYRVVPYDHPKRWLCMKLDGTAYLVEIDYFAPGQHACGCRWFEYHDWDGPPIKPCVHIRRVLGRVARAVSDNCRAAIHGRHLCWRNGGEESPPYRRKTA